VNTRGDRRGDRSGDQVATVSSMYSLHGNRRQTGDRRGDDRRDDRLVYSRHYKFTYLLARCPRKVFADEPMRPLLSVFRVHIDSNFGYI